MSSLLIYWWLVVAIGLTIALYRVFLKLVSIDKLLGMALQGIVVFVVGILLYLVFGSKKFDLSNADLKTWVGIIGAGTVLVLNGFLIMTGLRMGLNLSTFTPAYAIMGNIFVVIIWLLFFGEHINSWNALGLLLGLLGIYFLSIK